MLPPDSSLMVRRLADWRHMLCCSPSYLETHPEPANPADLSAHNCIRYAVYPFGDEWRFTNPEGGPLAVRVTGNLVTSDTELVRVAVIAGLGVTLMARLSTSMRSFEPVPSCPCCGATQPGSSGSRRSIRIVGIWRQRCASSSTRSLGCSPGATGSIPRALRLRAETR
jgi:DNA-binding transcriptional LysR family regulator